MDHFLRRERRRRRQVRDNSDQEILAQAMEIERQREEDLRRQFAFIVHNVKELERHRYARIMPHDRERRYVRHRNATSGDYKEQTRWESDSSSRDSHRRTHESSDTCLITLIYRGENVGRHGDEVMILQHDRIVFKGCLRQGDELTFKSERYRNGSRLKLEFYVNDLLEERVITCCEYALANGEHTRLFQVDHVSGTRTCQKCQAESSSTTPSPTPSPPPPPKVSKSKPSTKDNLSATTTSHGQQGGKQTTTNGTQKPLPTRRVEPPRPPVQDRQDQKPIQGSKSSEQKKEEKKSAKTSTLPLPQPNVEKASSEGFPADLGDLTESLPSGVDATEEQPRTTLINSFLPISSSTDRDESPPAPPKRVYGPPQLSTMLSVNEADPPFMTPAGSTINSTSASTNPSNVPQKRDNLSDSDTDIEEPVNQSNGFFEQLQQQQQQQQPESLVTRDTTNEPLSTTITGASAMIGGDATEALLARLGLIRQQQNERPEPIVNAPRQPGNVEYFVLIYLDSSPLDDSIVVRLRGLVNFLKIFDDTDDCVAFINSISSEKVILIVSDSLSTSAISRIEDLQQTLAIYVINQNDVGQEFRFEEQSKVKGSFSNFDDIYRHLSDDIDRVTRDLIVYMTIASNSVSPDPMFVFTQLITEIILDSDETDNAMRELIDFSRREYDGNQQELTLIDEFESDYQKERAVWWFTRKCFLSKMLNKALRVPEADILFKLRLFIQHLHAQIDNESISTTDDTPFIVYLGQTIVRDDLEDLRKSSVNGGLLFFGQFLSASTDPSIAARVAKDLPRLTDDYVPVVLRLQIPSGMNSANSASLRYSVDENNDILLNMGIMARITKIERESELEDGVSAVHLTQVRIQDERLIARMLAAKRTEIQGAAPLVTLTKLMVIMNQQARAEQLIQMIFDDEASKTDASMQGSVAASCHILGSACHAQGDFRRAAELFHLSLDTFLRFVPADAVQLSPTYNNIGSMYFRQDEYDKSAEYHQKALDVQLHSNSPNLSSIASYSNNLGVVFLKQKKFHDAAISFGRALQILQQTCEPNDPELASTYDNLGDANVMLDKYEEALKNYCKALEIQQTVATRNPQALASYNNSIGNVYNKLNRYGDALIHFKRAVELQEEYVPPNHPSFASLYNNIGSMYYRQDLFADALPFYLKSLEVELMCFPANHPTIAVTHFNIATTYTGLGRFDDAIASTERSVEQLLKTLPPNHPEVVENRSYIETIKRKQMLKELFETGTTIAF